MANEVNLTALVTSLQGRQGVDPRLFDVIKQLASQVDTLKNPIPVSTTLSEFSPGDIPLPPAEATIDIRKNGVVINWDNPDVGRISFFDVRRGDVWEDAERISLSPASFLALDPLTVGDHKIFIGSVGPAGPSETQLEVTVTIPPVGYLAIRSRVVANTVQLTWNEPQSVFSIDYYEFRRGSELIGNVAHTYLVYFENSAGTVEYSLTPVDIAGNRGPTVTESTDVSNPTDFELVDNLFETDADSFEALGIWDEGENILLAPVRSTQTFAQHFTQNSNARHISDLINAGHNLWCQPNRPGKSSIIYTFSIPAALTNVILEINWVVRSLVPSVAIAPHLEINGTEYTTKSTFLQNLPTSFKAGISITPTGAGLAEILGFSVAIVTKRAQDAGNAQASALDQGGTLIEFSREFSGVPDIAATVRDLAGFVAVINSKTATGFRVSVFDVDGTRATKTVDWLARGVV